MVTMMKEKVNTHFSFPLQLDMSPYMEKNLIHKERLQGWWNLLDSPDVEYSVISVTYHSFNTG